MKNHLYKFRFATLFLLLFLANVAFSLMQDIDGINIQGVITGPDGNPVSDASVMLWRTPWENPDLGHVVDSMVTGDDGSYSVSHVPTSVPHERDRTDLSTFEMGPAWPNPVGRESRSTAGKTNIPVRVATGAPYEIEVYSINGRLIRRSRNHLAEGVHTLSISLPETAGIYLVRVRGDQVNEMQTVTSFGGGGGVSIDVSSGTQVPFYRENEDISASMTSSSGDYTLRVDGGVYYGKHEAGFPESGVFQRNITLESLLGPEEPWLTDARERIKDHRMADFEIKVTDQSGNPIPDAVVDVQMTRHAFGFGSLLGVNRFEDRPNPEDARKHLEIVENYFNKAAAIRERNEISEFALNWLNERNIFVRGHYLMWARIQPGQRSGQPDEWPENEEVLREYAFDYIEDMITWADDRILEWNLINHIVTDVGGHTGYDDLFGDDFFAEVIKFARNIAPADAEMWVNEGRILPGAGVRQNQYYDVIQKLIEHDAKPDGIGFMSHFKREDDLTGMEEIYERLDRFAELVPNLQLTEFDIDLDDRQLQAQYMHEMMNIAFSHPAVSSITIWQIWGGSGDNEHLFDVDWTIRPHGEIYFDLIFNQWWTDEEGSTNSEGIYNTRGFLGDYKITVKMGHETKTVETSLDSDGANLDLIF